MTQRIPLILDADPAIGYFGRDVDDGLAILAALADPRLDVVALIVTFGNVSLKRGVRKAIELLRRAGRDDIPIYAGAANPSQRDEETEAARFLRRAVHEHPGLHLAALGPLTTLARVAQDPEFVAKLGGLWLLGGVLSEPSRLTQRPGFEFNFRQDIESARRVLAAPWAEAPVVVPMEVCRLWTLGPRDLWQIAQYGEVGRWAALQCLGWASLSPLLWGTPGFHPWDVVPLLALSRPELLRIHQAGYQLGERGELLPGPHPVRLATGLDPEEFRAAFLSRLSWYLAPASPR
jgi:inosine-uridine nucleoside N-ribohydrolase